MGQRRKEGLKCDFQIALCTLKLIMGRVGVGGWGCQLLVMEFGLGTYILMQRNEDGCGGFPPSPITAYLVDRG